MKKDIQLSVIVPIYNVEEYLNECLDSLYALKGISKEVILVNDGSTDGSGKIADTYKNKYPDITVAIHQENGGLSKARNSGIAASNGEYIYFIDSDDYIDVDKFTELYKKGVASNLDIICGKCSMFGMGYDEVMPTPHNLENLPPFSGREYLKHAYDNSTIYERNFRPEVTHRIYLRKLLQSNNIIFAEGIVHEDELFTPQIHLCARKVQSFDIVFYYYRQRKGSIMTSVDKSYITSKVKVSDTLVNLFLKQNFSHKFSNNRILGWYMEGRKLVKFSSILKALKLKKFTVKDYLLLIILTLHALRNSILNNSVE